MSSPTPPEITSTSPFSVNPSILITAPSSFHRWWKENQKQLIHMLQRAKCLHNPCLAPLSTPLHPDPAVSPSRQCHPPAGDSRAPGCCPPTFLQPELAQPGRPQRGAVALLTRAVVVEVREEHLRHPDPKLIRPAKGNGCERQSSWSSSAGAVSAGLSRDPNVWVPRGGEELRFGQVTWAAGNWAALLHVAGQPAGQFLHPLCERCSRWVRRTVF